MPPRCHSVPGRDASAGDLWAAGLTRAEQTLVPVPSEATLCQLYLLLGQLFPVLELCIPQASPMPGRDGAVRGFTGHRVHGRAEISCLGSSGMAKDSSLLPALPQYWLREAHGDEECSVMSKAAIRSKAQPLPAVFPMPRFKGAEGWEGKQSQEQRVGETC